MCGFKAVLVFFFHWVSKERNIFLSELRTVLTSEMMQKGKK